MVKVHERVRTRSKSTDPYDDVIVTLILRNLEAVRIPADRRIYHGLHAILAARDGDIEELLRHTTRLTRKYGAPVPVETRDGVELRWPWLHVTVPRAEAPRIVRELLKVRFGRYTEDLEKLKPRTVAATVLTAPLIALGAGGKGSKGGAKALKGVKLSKLASKALAKAAKKGAAKKIAGRLLEKIVLKTAAAVLPPVLAMTAFYYEVARKVDIPSPWLRGLVLAKLQYLALVTGLWCWFAPIPVGLGHTELLPVIAAGSAILAVPALITVHTYHVHPIKYPVALDLQPASKHRKTLLAAGYLGLLTALIVSLAVGSDVGEPIGLASLLPIAAHETHRALRARRIAVRMWLPEEAVPREQPRREPA